MKTATRLLLVPTDWERQKLPSHYVEQWLDCGHRIEISGFGQVVAAARTMQLLATSSFDMGWHQWPREPMIQDAIQLSAHKHDHPLPGLVSVLAASATPAEAAWRHSRFPLGKAEDMEGFGVAVSCRLANVPLMIVRGISNRAGDRDHAKWNIAGSLDQAMQMILQKVLQPQEVSQ
jgi:nucleoside phosphorylase